MELLYNKYLLSKIKIFRESAEQNFDLTEYGMLVIGRESLIFTTENLTGHSLLFTR